MRSQDPIALTFKGPHKKWWYGGSAAVVLFGLLVAHGGDNGNLSLEVKRGNMIDAADDGKLLAITNIGVRPLTITKVVINGRPDCANDTRLPAQLDIGDRHLVFSICRVVRVEIDADEGSATYGFGG